MFILYVVKKKSSVLYVFFFYFNGIYIYDIECNFFKIVIVMKVRYILVINRIK